MIYFHRFRAKILYESILRIQETGNIRSNTLFYSRFQFMGHNTLQVDSRIVLVYKNKD